MIGIEIDLLLQEKGNTILSSNSDLTDKNCKVNLPTLLFKLFTCDG